MAEKYSNFRSLSTISAQRQEDQHARDLILEKAKQKYEAEEARREKARKAGEGTWMLDSVAQRLDKEKKVLEKAKKTKKDKKKKKKKKKKEHCSSLSSSSDEEEATWVESGGSQAKETAVERPQLQLDCGTPCQRESWMEAPIDLIPMTSRQEIRDKINQEKAQSKREATKMLEPGQHVRELNPHWKDGGTGVPEEKPSTKVLSKYVAGDGGLSWLRTAMVRCKQQAVDESRSLEEVAAERWGSLKRLKAMLEEAEWLQGVKSSRNRSISQRQNDRERNRDKDGDRRVRGIRHSSSSNSEEDTSRSSRCDRERRDRGREDMWKRDIKYEDREMRSSRDRYQSNHNYNELSHRKSCFKHIGSDSDGDTRDNSSKYLKSKGFMKPSVDSNFTSSKGLKEISDFHGESGERKSSGSFGGRKFVRPGDDDEDGDRGYRKSHSKSSEKVSGIVPRWKKKFPDSEIKNELKDEEMDTRKEKKANKKCRTPSPSSSESISESESNASAKDTKDKMDQPVVQILTEEELNDLAAKILRAEIMGEDDLAAELKSKLEAARKQREDAKSGTSAAPDFSAYRGNDGERIEGRKRQAKGEESEDEDNVVVLSRTNKAGMVRPVLGQSTDDWGREGGKRKRKNVATHDSKGDRTTYFDNDNRFDLKTLVEQEKSGTAEDQNSMFARLAGRSGDRDLDIDDMFVSRAAEKQNDEKTFSLDRTSAIFEHKKRTAAMAKCQRCLSQVPKHLIIALGSKSYLCLPHHRSLTEGHCYIVPMAHTLSATVLDEDVWQEMQNFRKSLVHMFSAQDLDVVVMETVMHLKHFPHTAIECIPLEKEVGDLAPIYFKKAIQEAGPEWSDNKKLHDLKGRDVRRVIPKGFPYFAVDFGLESGFATVLEDEASFPAYFGREIVGGMIDAEPTLWRKPHKQSFEDQRRKVLQFEKWWKPYDWTQDISAAD